MYDYTNVDRIIEELKYEDDLDYLRDKSWEIDELKFFTQMSAKDQREWYAKMLKTFNTKVAPLLDEGVTNVAYKALLVKKYRKLRNKEMKEKAQK